ncbi:replication initiation factor [Brevibacillus halotolerans]|uniref:replication initiation factor n=1 Tax=Brevibacillus TaxID=55080 RepID=UPI00215BBA60|nr:MULTISPECIES: replication initiation factor [Brevibacillus]MCR8963938.1 replication initiation factor [Brevibacillus laterosporus]MCZ0836093.1 replication initiation factor [Brevibacillus halotolerans]
MPGANYSKNEVKPLILKGIDTLEFGLDVEDYLPTFNSYLDYFKKLKEAAQTSGVEQTLTIGNLTLTVHRTGIPFYAYKLTCNDFSICFMDKEMKGNSPIFVRLMSSFLWSYGYKQAYYNFLEWFLCFQPNLSGIRLSRSDICVDLDEASFKQCDSKGVVKRARRQIEHFVNGEYKEGRKFSGFTIGGGGPILARIYNKSLEVKKSQKLWFQDIWRENGWNESKEVWRVEFQIRREALKEFSIHSANELFDNEDQLWAYLTEEWLTIKQPTKDNVSRWKIKRKWKLVQTAGMNYKPSPLIRERVKKANLKQLLDQAAGLMLSVAALSNHDSFKDTTQKVQSWAENNLIKKNTSFLKEKQLRRGKYLFAEDASNITGGTENEST